MALEGYKLLNPWVSFDIIGGPRGITGADFRDALVSFKFSDKSDGKLPKFEMQFDNSSGRFLNFATLLIGLKLKIRFGYENLLSRPYTVPIKKIKGGAMGGVGKGVRSPMPDVYGVVAMEALGDVQKMNYSPKDDVWMPTSPMPLSRMVKQIARKYGFRETKIFVQEGLGIDTQKESLFDKSQIKDKETVREFLQRKAEERGFVFFIQRNEFHWHREDWKVKPHDTITYFEGPDLLSFALEGDYNLNLINVKAKALNPKTGKILSPVISNEGELIGLGGVPLRRGVPPEHAQPKDIVSSISLKAAEAAVARMTSHVLRRWKAKLTLVGNPSIFVGSALNLVNFGPVIDGTWYVREVEHVINPDGYTTTIQASARKRAKRGRFVPVPVIDERGNIVGLGGTYKGQAVRDRTKRRRPRQKVQK